MRHARAQGLAGRCGGIRRARWIARSAGALGLALAGCDPSAPTGGVGAAPPAATPAPKLEVDLARQQVFVPSVGWVRADEFWNLYYQHPEKLPGDIDAAAIAQLPGDPHRSAP